MPFWRTGFYSWLCQISWTSKLNFYKSDFWLYNLGLVFAASQSSHLWLTPNVPSLSKRQFYLKEYQRLGSISTRGWDLSGFKTRTWLSCWLKTYFKITGTYFKIPFLTFHCWKYLYLKTEASVWNQFNSSERRFMLQKPWPGLRCITITLTFIHLQKNK